MSAGANRMSPTWKAPEQVRLRRAADWLIRHVPDLWHVSEHQDQYGGYAVRLDHLTVALLPEPQRGYYEATLEGLAREFGPDALEQVVPELFFFTAEGLFRDRPEQYDSGWWVPRGIALHACRIWMRDRVPEYAVELAVARLRHMVCHGLAAYELTPTWAGTPDSFHPPDARECQSLLVEWSDRPAARAAIRELLDGEWDRPVVVPPAIRQAWEERGQGHLVQEYEGRGTYHYCSLSTVLAHGVVDLAARGELTVDRLLALARRTPHAVPAYMADRDYEPEGEGERAVAPTITEFLWQVVQELDEPGLELASSYYGPKVRGARFVLKACEHIETRGLSSVSAEGYEKLPGVLRWMADAHLGEGDTLDALAVELGRFTPATLRTALPHAPATEEAFLTALGWTAALPLLRLTRRIAARTHQTAYESTPDAPNCSDPTSGVVERAEIAALIEAAGPKLARQLMATLRSGRIKVDHTTKLVEAVGGWNRKQIEKGLKQFGQVNLKALGLLPLERGDEEVVERYRLLRQASRDCRKFGPERQTNTRAAVLAALANLAQTAGYDDTARMEWAVEAQIAETNADPRARVGDYEVAVEMPELDPRIVVRRADRVLASVPPPVRKAKEYKALRETVAELKAQVTRFRRSLEDMMTEGRAFDAADLAGVSRLPALERLVGRLVLRRPDGTCGLLVAEGLRGPDGPLLPARRRRAGRAPHPARRRRGAAGVAAGNRGRPGRAAVQAGLPRGVRADGGGAGDRRDPALRRAPARRPRPAAPPRGPGLGGGAGRRSPAVPAIPGGGPARVVRPPRRTPFPGRRGAGGERRPELHPRGDERPVGDERARPAGRGARGGGVRGLSRRRPHGGRRARG